MVRVRSSSVAVTRKLATGTYTGDGAATQAIVGIGFQPITVLIFPQVDPCTSGPAVKADVDLINAIIWRDTVAVDAWVNQIDEIISLDVDGFTVGDGDGALVPGNKLNVNLWVYTYICWA